MAAKGNIRRTRTGASPLGDLLAVGLLLAGLLHFLALASYNPHDLPTWVSFHPASQPNSPVDNFIGPMGAVLAGYSFFVFGAAAYLLPTCLIWFGVSKLLSAMKISKLMWAGAALLAITAAALLQIQPWFFPGWRESYMSLGPGGGTGYLLGKVVLASVIGRIGAGAILLVLYATAFVLLSGMHPFDFVLSFRQWLAETPAKVMALFRRETTWHWPWQREMAVEGIAAKRSAAPESAPVAKKTATPKAKAKSEDKTEQPKEEELSLDLQRPEPKIIDASAPRLDEDEEAEPKPSLDELMSDLRARRQKKKIHSSSDDDVSLEDAFGDFELPPLNLLNFDRENAPGPTDKLALLETQTQIVETLKSFKIEVSPGDITRGPTITRYEVYPSQGLSVNRITAREADLARATCAESINILAPIPGRDTVGIEIANTNRATVALRELLEDPAFKDSKAKIPLALGKDVYGRTIVGDLASMPHLIVSGSTGSGKSVCIGSIITSILYNFRPDQLRFIMVDPKVVEMQPYANLPHLAIPLVTEPTKVLLALRWVLKEMEARYQMFKKTGCKDFTSFNGRLEREEAKRKKVAADRITMDGNVIKGSPAEEIPDDSLALAVNVDGGLVEQETEDAAPPAKDENDGIPDTLPYIVVIIDELADLMDTAPADVELAIVRIAQMARASGIHLILATQTPRAEVITGRIRANVPSKIAFRVTSATESRVILEAKGAERLVGKGDMLYLAPGTSQVVRAQGALVTEEEIHDLVTFVSEQGLPVFAAGITETLEGSGDSGEGDDDIDPEDEETLEKCIDVLRQEGKASASMLQRRLRLGYNRASRMMDVLEMRGIVGPGDGAKPREILVDLGCEED